MVDPTKLVHSFGRKPGVNPKFQAKRFRKDLITRFRAAITPKYSYMDGFAAPFDQMGYGACVANATAALHMFFGGKRGKIQKNEMLSRSAIYWRGKQNEGGSDKTTDDGMQVTDGILVPENWGYLFESEHPYPTAYQGDDATLFAPVKDSAWRTNFKFKNYVSVQVDIASIKMALLKHGPAIFGIDFPVDWENPTSDGLLTANPQQGSAGGHCMIFIGFDDTILCDDGSRGALLVRNSWGTTWAKNGYAWMPYTVINTSFFADEIYTVAA